MKKQKTVQNRTTQAVHAVRIFTSETGQKVRALCGCGNKSLQGGFVEYRKLREISCRQCREKIY